MEKHAHTDFFHTLRPAYISESVFYFNTDWTGNTSAQSHTCTVRALQKIRVALENFSSRRDSFYFFPTLPPPSSFPSDPLVFRFEGRSLSLEYAPGVAITIFGFDLCLRTTRTLLLSDLLLLLSASFFLLCTVII